MYVYAGVHQPVPERSVVHHHRGGDYIHTYIACTPLCHVTLPPSPRPLLSRRSRWASGWCVRTTPATTSSSSSPTASCSGTKVRSFIRSYACMCDCDGDCDCDGVSEEFAANVQWALNNDPLPLTDQLRYTLTWEAATERSRHIHMHIPS